jgi:Zn finger protein HypA/HybF involved in hydrogenase expression
MNNTENQPKHSSSASYPLFKHMLDTYGLTLVETELDEIKRAASAGTANQDKVICPHCGEENKDLSDAFLEVDEIKPDWSCLRCDESFVVSKHTTTTFTTRKV